ncbi:DUF4382 domain-containing protein [Aestuariibaculum suncheonense]|uniref:DUF4382 domain-containing protein n=1 Tax=Aestuariibaculum suncheonense TaxID=1028745 RepID=A0A8J6UE50_9FLAO|nr:DUF4382 domain-containing protein [Aestuariibaculum suncheonense]MBD0836837.1 DUF4382 domain-containing protein [Aestuariibaculum suncheonense]
MKTLKQLKFILPLLLLTFVFGCKDSESDGVSAEAPKISVRLVDAPGDYAAVNVNIVDVMIKMNDDSDSDQGWMSLEATGGMVNLLDFTGGFSKVLVDRFPIPAGTLSQMRLVLGDGNTIDIAVDDEGNVENYPLKTPSAQQSGLKVKIDAVIEEGFTYDYVLDFDVDKSIVMAGNSDNIILKPVLYASAEVSSGIIEGTVEPMEALPAMASVLVDDMGTEETEDDFVISAITDENGAFALWGVPAGTYEVMVSPIDGESDYGSASAMDVVVVNGEITAIAEPIVLMMKPGSISGTVLGLAEGVNAEVSIVVDDMGTEDTADDVKIMDTTEAGVFLLEEVPAGDYIVTISAEGYVTQTVNVTVTPGADTPAGEITLVVAE